MNDASTPEPVSNKPLGNLNIAYYQQNICWEDSFANYKQIEQAFTEFFASSPSFVPDVLVVPETFNTGFGDNMGQLAEPPMGATYDFAVHIASLFGALFVGTWTVREDNVVYNRLHWVCPDGTFGYYDKGHTFQMSSEAAQLARGTRRAIFEWRGWRIKPAICYDLRFPNWLRNNPTCYSKSRQISIPTKYNKALNIDNSIDYSPLSYDLLLVCANWPSSRAEAWTTLLKARAIENSAYVIGVNRVGTDGIGINYSGNSAAIDFKGHILLECMSGRQQVQGTTLIAEELQNFRYLWPFYLDAD